MTTRLEFISLTGPPGVDPASEAVSIYGRAVDYLDAVGLSFADVLFTRFSYSSQNDFPPLNSVRDPLYRARMTDGNFPAATGVVTGARTGDAPRVGIEFIAGPGKKTFNSDSVAAKWGDVAPPFRHAITTGDLVITSGMTSRRPDASTSADFDEQFDQTIRNLADALAAAGSRLDDVVRFTLYVSELVRVDRVFGRLSDFLHVTFGEEPPVVTVTGIHELTFTGGFTIELEAVATSSGDVTFGPTVTGRASEVGGILPAHSAAARAGEWIFSTAGASAGSAGTPIGDTIRAALAELAEVTAPVAGGRGVALRQVTVWVAPTEAMDAAQHALEAALAPDVAVAVIALIAQVHTHGSVRLQAISELDPF